MVIRTRVEPETKEIMDEVYEKEGLTWDRLFKKVFEEFKNKDL